MQIVEVNSEALAADFISMPVRLYANDPNYIRPLDKDIEAVFSKEKNKAYRHGETIRWLLKEADGRYSGRIAAFVNSKYKSKGDDVPVGGIGFFECENNPERANLLLDTARQWLAAKGMQAMDGPINFGERDRWWGMVMAGYEEPLYCMNYNPPYYNELFTNYGFRPFFYQLCFGTKPKDPLSNKVMQRHAQLKSDPAFSSEIFHKNQIDKYVHDFTLVYNKAWAGHGGLKQLNEKQVKAMFKTMLPVMDRRIIYFAYHQKEPIAIFINLPDLNQWFKYLHGRFGLIDKLKFLWVKATKKNKKFTGIVFGVVPEWQGKGVDSFIIGETHSYVGSENSPYTEYEMQWIGDFNPKMVNVAKSLGDVHESRKLVTYRYLFDRNKPFERHPIF